MAVLIKTNGDVSIVSPANGKFFTLTELQGYVGGLIQLAPRTIHGSFLFRDVSDGDESYGMMLEWNNTYVAWVNEEGLLDGLEYNQIASMFIGYPIVGDMLIVEPWQQEQDDEDEEFESLRRTDTYDGDDGQDYGEEDWLDEDDYARHSEDDDYNEYYCERCGSVTPPISEDGYCIQCLIDMKKGKLGGEDGSI